MSSASHFFLPRPVQDRLCSRAGSVCLSVWGRILNLTGTSRVRRRDFPLMKMIFSFAFHAGTIINRLPVKATLSRARTGAESQTRSDLPACLPGTVCEVVFDRACRRAGPPYRALISNWTRVDELEVSELEIRRIRNERTRNAGGGHITPPPGSHS